jgi:hypothetical protein
MAAGALVVVRAIQDERREREWLHGGDSVVTSVDIRLVDAAGVGAAVADLGGPDLAIEGDPRGEHVVPASWQVLAARVSWSHAPAAADSAYCVVALDKRVWPPRIVHASQSWTPGGGPRGQGWIWGSAFAVLAQHYYWLADAASVQSDVGISTPGSALHATATSSGTIIGTWFVDKRDTWTPQLHDTTGVILALVFFERGQVRWAKRIFG